MKKHPWFPLPWHPSGQPDVIRFPKRQLRAVAALEYLTTGLTAAAWAPLVATAYATAPAGRTDGPSADFCACAVGDETDPGRWREVLALVRDLGLRRTLLRVPVWRRAELPRFRAWAEDLATASGNPPLIAVLQERASVSHPGRWAADLHGIFRELGPVAEAFQVPIAPNRTKWGCFHTGEALDLLTTAHRVAARHPGVRLAGPSVIDFEPLPAARLLLNFRRFTVQAVTAQLYVDRRGGPHAKQYGWFDLARKIRLQWALGACSARVAHGAPLWITEVNWPIVDTDEFSPAADDVCVTEDTAAGHLLEYYRIAWATGLVQRVYWWSLVHPGFGLVDPRGGGLRQRSAYHALRGMLRGG